MRPEVKIKKELNIEDVLNYLEKSNIKFERVDNPSEEELSFLDKYFAAKNEFFNNMKKMFN